MTCKRPEAVSKRSFSFIFCVFTPNPVKGTHRKKRKILHYPVEFQ
jgi:hypothetical protein